MYDRECFSHFIQPASVKYMVRYLPLDFVIKEHDIQVQILSDVSFFLQKAFLSNHAP